MKIAVIGAGMAGLASAEPLITAGHAVHLFDKGRGPGGRMSTRRMETSAGEMRWDHGAQFFTARSDEFQAQVDAWLKQGVAAEWQGSFLELGGSTDNPPRTKNTRYVGAPGMNEIIRYMASTFEVEWAKRVSAIEGEPGAWALNFEGGNTEGGFDSVLLAIPAEQAIDLLAKPAPNLTHAAASVRTAPCWAVMLGFSERLEAGFDGAKLSAGPLGWIARNASKPGREDAETWVLHASPEWSREHLDEAKEDVALQLAQTFCLLTDAPTPVFSAAHRWLYAMVESGVGAPFLWDADLKIGACGDWCIAPRVEAAWQSGYQLGSAVAEDFG